MVKQKWILQHYSRVKVVFVVAITLVLFLSLVTLRGHNEIEEYISTIERTDSVIQEIRFVKKTVTESQLSIKGYLASGDRQLLSSFQEALDESEVHFAQLDRVTSKKPKQSQRLEKLKSLVAAEFQAGLQIVALKSNNQTEEAQKKLSSSTAKARALEIKKLLYDFERDEVNTQQMRLLQLDQSVLQQRNLQYMSFLLGLIFLSLSWAFVMMTLRQKDQIETELNRFFASSPDLFCIASLDTTLKRSNPSYKDLLGYSETDLLDRSFLDFVHSDDREMVLHELKDLKSRNLSTTSFECRCIRKDNSSSWFSWKISLVADSSAFYGVGRDITERKKLEAENLEARQIAQAANRAKSQFLANVSHEIRTPLNGVMGMTKLLLGTSLNAEQKEQAENILASSTNLLNVMNDVLDLSKIEAGHMTIEKIDFNLNQLVSEVTKSLKPLADQKQIALQVDCPTLDCQIRGDATRLRQVLLNLTSNAIKFTEKGSVHVTIESQAEPESDFSFKFTIQDTGIGMSDKTMKKLFKAFSQADASTSRRYGGTGLGLSICKQLVSLMGGQIGASSMEGQGSTFWFELPFEKALSSQFAQPAPIFKHNTYSGRVLVADDNLINQKVIARTLEKCGLTVDVAQDGLQVMSALEENPHYDVIFLDGHMPNLDGYETAKRIRSDVSKPYFQVTIVALTANALKGEREKCLQMGMNEFLTKPLHDQQLHFVLQKYLSTPKSMQPAVPQLQAASSKMSKGVIDLVWLNKLEALQEDGQPDVVVELIESYLQQTPDRISLLKQYIETKKFDEACDEAHSLKSSARTLGANQLGDLLESVELMRSNPDLKKFIAALTNLQTAFEHAQAELLRISETRRSQKAA